MAHRTPESTCSSEARIPAWIIEEELKRERQKQERPFLELPVPESYETESEDEGVRGVIVIDL